METLGSQHDLHVASETIHYVELTRHNLSHYVVGMMSLMRNATFIAVDCEFTGLGLSRPETRATNIEDRYMALRKLVDTHALVAVGLSIFIERPVNNKHELPGSRQILYDVHIFQLLLCCTQDYMVSPESLRFLVDNGYDLNRLVRDGVPYQPMSTLEMMENAFTTPEAKLLKSLFDTLITAGRPLIVHNGWLDLLFLYHGFYAPLPNKLQSFVADLREMFPGGIWDTKYTSDYIDREPASFLALLYRKCERLHKRRCKQASTSSGLPYISCITHRMAPTIPTTMTTPSTIRESTDSTQATTSKPDYCQKYANHGHCPMGRQCPYSHSLDVILDAQERRTSRKTNVNEQKILKRNDIDNVDTNQSASKRHCSIAASTTTSTTTASTTTVPDPSQYHAAYFDAFMTGYVHAAQRQAQLESNPDYNESQLRSLMGDRLYLIGKSMPLPITHSVLASTSAGHRRRMALLP